MNAMIDPSALPDVRAHLEKINALDGPGFHEMEPEVARALFKDGHLVAEPEIGDLAVLRDAGITRPDGTSLSIRIFDAREDRGSGPVVVFYHGGGWVVGTIDGYSSLCAEIARQLDLPVISVDYRLAPEYPWPAGPEDAELAARAIADWPEVTGLILAGDSAGGTLTIVTALALRDKPASVPVLAQWPIYPSVDNDMSSRSFDAYGQNHGLTREGVAWCHKYYAADPDSWPIKVSQAGLPPTLVLTAQLDVLADQGRAYAERCEREGVRTILRESPGRLHGYLTSRKVMPSGQDELTASIQLLKQLLP